MLTGVPALSWTTLPVTPAMVPPSVVVLIAAVVPPAVPL
jgi:hypothetical protein